jgi:hypothetical protein
MSLPSYDEVKSYKASVETVKSLVVTPSTTNNKPIGLRTTADKESSSAADESKEEKGGLSVSTFLPSMGKQGPKSSSPQGYSF